MINEEDAIIMKALQNRVERLEAVRGRADGVSYVVMYDHAAQVRRWSGRTEWLTLNEALPYIGDPSIKVYQATDDFDPEAI